MKFIIPLFLFTLLVSCHYESNFDLNKDMYQFSERMENGDTIEVNINYSACMYSAYEVFTFTKQNDTTFLQTHSEINSFENRKQNLPKKNYKPRISGGLSFENYFEYLNKENRPKTDVNSPLVIAYYKNKAQTKAFYDNGLEDKLKKLDRFAVIRNKIYPDDTFFREPEPPPPPSIK